MPGIKWRDNIFNDEVDFEAQPLIRTSAFYIIRRQAPNIRCRSHLPSNSTPNERQKSKVGSPVWPDCSVGYQWHNAITRY